MIDGRRLEEGLTGPTLQDMLVDLLHNRLGGQRILREVFINGQPYAQDTMGPASSLPRENISSLKVDTMDAVDVARQFLKTGPDFLEPIIESAAKVAELFRVADEKEANEHYLNYLESLQSFLQILDASRHALNLDFKDYKLEGLSAEKRLERISDLFQELLDAQKERDWVLLADILQYDLVPELRAWQGFLTKLAQEQGV
ncbi:MAG: hypothetical protein KQJ78_00290 [Deltaproteobacteria bacterium]|nr:hypothetical protein [Deltaproteobacteria bacterium]